MPSAPPQSVTAGVINSTSAWIRWEPPPAQTWNGELVGYLVIFIIADIFCASSFTKEEIQFNIFYLLD